MASLGADLVVAVHACFVAFVVLGGLLVWRSPRLAWLHVPALLWGMYVMTGHACPLTALEGVLRHAAGGAMYAGGCIEHYLGPVYERLKISPPIRLALNVALLVLNGLVYAVLGVRKARALMGRSGRG